LKFGSQILNGALAPPLNHWQFASPSVLWQRQGIFEAILNAGSKQSFQGNAFHGSFCFRLTEQNIRQLKGRSHKSIFA
jgi:hypothetical protein